MNYPEEPKINWEKLERQYEKLFKDDPNSPDYEEIDTEYDLEEPPDFDEYYYQDYEEEWDYAIPEK